MKIVQVETYPLYYHLKEPYADANGFKNYRTCYLFRIRTASGITGWGEVIDWLPTLDVGFRERIIPYLLGKEATERLSIVKTISKWHKRIASGVSMALTEIIAQYAKLSLSDLWGGSIHSEVPVYASFQSYSHHANWIDHSLKLVEKEILKGFNQCKVKIGGKEITEDQKHVIKLQERFGDQIGLILDANQSYDLATSYQWKRLLDQPSNILWLEEPLPIDQVSEYKRLRASFPIAIAGGENLKSATAFLSFVIEGALDIIQPDLNHLMGVDEYRSLLLLARMAGLRVSSHTFDGALSRLYTLYAHSCLPAWSKMEGKELEPVEWDVMENPFTQLLTISPVQGMVKIPNGIGIGVEMDMERIAYHRWDGSIYY